MLPIITLLCAYLLGSVPGAILISRWLHLPDPRSIGSGNPGATNVLRSGSKIGAALTLLIDALKGVPAVVFAQLYGLSMTWICLIAFAALLGHMYPVFLRFRGGKGVATTLGILCVLHWPLALVWGITWLIIAKVLKYSSLAALTATALLAPVAWLNQQPPELIYFLVALTVMVFWRHRQNIKNLILRRESKIGGRK